MPDTPNKVGPITTVTNTRGDKRISPKWIPTDAFDYLKEASKKENLTETAIITRALRLDKEVNGSSKHS